MDRQAVIGFVIIGVILLVWMSLQAPPPQQRQAGADSVQQAEKKESRHDALPEGVPSVAVTKDFGKFFSGATTGVEKNLIIETDLYRAEITTKGGLIRRWELKNFRTWNGYPVQLVSLETGGDLSLLFTSSDGKLIDTKGLYFKADFPSWNKVVLDGKDEYRIDLVLNADNGGRIIKTLRFVNGKYSLDCEIHFERMEEVVAGYEYQVTWESGLPYAEQNSVDESSFAASFAYSGGELVEVNASHPGEPAKSNISGDTRWVAARTKYFALAIIPEPGVSQGAFLGGDAKAMPDHGIMESYAVGLRMPYRGAQQKTNTFTVFLGPLDFGIIKGYGADLDQIMGLGLAWIIRPIAEWVMIPLFQFLKSFIPNYGVVIILFSIIIKLLLHPLTKASLKSMRKMQALQPMMEEIRTKHKEDPQKMNRQMMQLYKDYGVNPAGGCLPLLLQFPILYALWVVFRSAIELRQAHFVWWITDLSVHDVIVRLPFAIPLLGMHDVSGLALAMGITMFIQQKMTIKDPRQKMMVWMMPIMLTLLFNSFPSGLNLYYFVFNLLSIGQQAWFNRRHANDPLRKVEPRKQGGGFMNRITKDLPKLKR